MRSYSHPPENLIIVKSKKEFLLRLVLYSIILTYILYKVNTIIKKIMACHKKNDKPYLKFLKS